MTTGKDIEDWRLKIENLRWEVKTGSVAQLPAGHCERSEAISAFTKAAGEGNWPRAAPALRPPCTQGTRLTKRVRLANRTDVVRRWKSNPIRRRIPAERGMSVITARVLTQRKEPRWVARGAYSPMSTSTNILLTEAAEVAILCRSYQRPVRRSVCERLPGRAHRGS